MKLDKMYEQKRPVLSFEIYPPRMASALKDIDETLEILSELKPDFISVTFGAGGSERGRQTIELAKRIKYDYHIEPLVHLTCLNYDRQEIDAFTKEMKENGIENILALRGDRNPDYPPKHDFEHASDLTSYLKQTGDFCVAGACYPECHLESKDRVSDVRSLKTKVNAGASFLITQLFLDNSFFYSFEENARIAGIKVPISAGILPVINKAQIEKMVSICGASLPDKFAKIISKFENNKEALFDAGMAYALNQVIDLLVNDVDGIHLYTMNNPAVARKLCEGIRHIL